MQKQHGLTLIELLISVAIIGLVSNTAIPAYSEYTIRAKLTEAVSMAQSCQRHIIESIFLGEMYGTNQWGCEINPLNAPNQQASKFVRSVQTDDHGVITITLQNFNNALLDGKVINFAPLNHEGYVVTADNMEIEGPVSHYDCRTSTSSGYGVPVKYLPKPCHGV